jgi:hypothetical protein
LLARPMRFPIGTLGDSITKSTRMKFSVHTDAASLQEIKCMIKISQVMRDLLSKALADGTPCLVGTASKEGHPQISPKGSLAVFDEQALC